MTWLKRPYIDRTLCCEKLSNPLQFALEISLGISMLSFLQKLQNSQELKTTKRHVINNIRYKTIL